MRYFSFSLFPFIPSFWQHVYPKGYICLAAIYNRRDDAKPDQDAWETKQTLFWAVSNILIMLGKVDRQKRPDDYSRYEGMNIRDPRRERWRYHDI